MDLGLGFLLAVSGAASGDVVISLLGLVLLGSPQLLAFFSGTFVLRCFAEVS